MKSMFVIAVPSLAVAGLAAIAWLPSPAVVEDPILTIHGAALESMLLTAATDKQDVLPIMMQRGSRLDGSMRSRPMQHMAIQGNPYENVWSGTSLNGIHLETGTFDISDVDLALPAEGFSWIIGRSYNNRQYAGGAHTSQGPQGACWFNGSMPEIALYEGANDADDVLYLITGADRYTEHARVSESATTFRGCNGAAGVFEFTEGGEEVADLYTLYDQNGNKLDFFGFDEDAAPASGMLWRITDPAENVAYVGDATDMAAAISGGYDDDGFITTAFDSSGRKYTYTYTDDAGSTSRLMEVVAEVNDDGWVEVGRVNYEYYASNGTHGNVGDLQLVEITTPLTDSDVNLIRKKFYRYWNTGAGGSAHDIKMIVGFEGTRRFDLDDDSTFNESFTSASDNDLKPYSEAYFEYSGHQIITAIYNGECGCSGGSSGEYTISYGTNGSYTNNGSPYDQEWYSRAVVERPDGTYVTQYFDEVGQPLAQVITDGNPTGSPNRWVTNVARDTSGRVTSVFTPASLDTYTHSTGVIENLPSTGLVWNYTRESTDACSGFVSAKTWQVGDSGDPVSMEAYAYEYFTRSINTGEAIVCRPIRTTVARYPNATTGGAGTAETTTLDPTESAASLALGVIETENETVTTGKNGSDSPTYHKRYLRDDGTVSFEEAEDGVLTYQEYTGGQLTKLIEDALYTETGDFDVTPPTGSGSAVHRITTYTYDAQGRRDTETMPDERVIKYYYSKLLDGRMVTLRYNDFDSGTPTFYGPVQYTVTNLAGKAEVQATVGLTGNSSTTALTGHVNELSADPISAMTLGSVVRMATNVYDDSGTHVQENRSYFNIPGSGAGSDGTNYDGTFYGYDDMGRQWRVKAPYGTINRTVYDALGRTKERWIGTNDYSFVGGEGSGPDNMVKIEALEYDGDADDGNGYLTERTMFVQDSATDSRVTTYANDARGRVLLETPPTAPYAFHAYDNYGRRTATGLYDSTGDIALGTDDPVSESTNRLALNETAYDELGRVWKTTRHKIVAGANSGSLESLTWYDATGRVIKQDGSQLTKTAYDRLGRQTHQFILAVAKNSGGGAETAYADADDVAYDIVLEEHQTAYESSNGDDVLMRVSIARFHDDIGGSPTTGALDSNADGNWLVVTPGNLSGRPQITGFWYDTFGRLTNTVRYGTYANSTFTRASMSPNRDDTELCTTNTYDIDGTVQDVTDPRNIKTRTLYDDAGRTTATIRNYVNGTPSGVDGDDDVYTRYTYVDGLRTEIWVDFDGDGSQDEGDQVTRYIYGTTNGTPSASEISSGHLLRATVYPDSTNSGDEEGDINTDPSDVVSFAYNAQGQEVYKKDQAGNVLESEYDDSGRRTKLKATAIATGSGFDDDVERLEWVYTSLGQVETITSYDEPSSGSALNEVKYAYDGWGNVTSFKQDKNGTVGGSGYYGVTYTWAAASTGRNTIRKTAATLPSGATLTYNYISAGGRFDDAASRVTSIDHGVTSVVQYSYNGVGQVVTTDYRQPHIKWDLSQGTASTYPDLDIFSRVTSSRWTSDLTTDVDFFDLDITYDENSNITRVVDNILIVPDTTPDPAYDDHIFDWLYTIDGLDRLVRAERGDWTGSIIDEQQEDQTWTLDQVGNWDHVTLDLDDDNSYGGADEYDDDRAHNDVNELETRDVDNDTNPDYTLVYDAVGNLTDDDEEYKYVYDPFGRLRMIKTQSNDLVAEYKYNGLGHMIAVHEDVDINNVVDGDDPWYYPAYDERWRMVASFRNDDTAPKEEWVNQDAGLDGRGGSSYINGVVLRNKDANTAWTSASDGTLEERIYLCQNWRGDVSALVYANGDQVEQVRYSPYGTPFGLPGGDCDSDGDCDDGDTVDSDQVQAWINATAYDVRGDLDLDGDVDASDSSLLLSAYQAGALGFEQLSMVQNRQGLGGYWATHAGTLARNRVLSLSLGCWLSRDVYEYIDNYHLYAYVSSRPVQLVDPLGLYGGLAHGPAAPGTDGGYGGGSVTFEKDICPEWKEWVECLLKCFKEKCAPNDATVKKIMDNLEGYDYNFKVGDVPDEPGKDTQGWTTCGSKGVPTSIKIEVSSFAPPHGSPGSEAGLIGHELTHTGQCKDGGDPHDSDNEKFANNAQEQFAKCGCEKQQECGHQWNKYRKACPDGKKPKRIFGVSSSSSLVPID
jgi:YD repeat-containing protein